MRGMSLRAEGRSLAARPLTPLLLTAVALVALLTACASRPAVRPQVLSGSFAGEAADGTPIALTFTERAEAFRGAGTIGGSPVVVAGAVGWRGVGTLTGADGSPKLVELSLTADGGGVVLERFGAEPVSLDRVGPAPAATQAPAGPFSGRYRATEGRAVLAQVTLVQSGQLIAGAGIVVGDPAGVAGRTTGPRTADGVVTLLDGTQTRISAEVAADGRSLVVRGYGPPLTLTRVGAR